MIPLVLSGPSCYLHQLHHQHNADCAVDRIVTGRRFALPAPIPLFHSTGGRYIPIVQLWSELLFIFYSNDVSRLSTALMYLIVHRWNTFLNII